MTGVDHIEVEVGPRLSGKPGVALTTDWGPEMFIALPNRWGAEGHWIVRVLDETGFVVDDGYVSSPTELLHIVARHCGAHLSERGTL
jgi:hypothetical protein